MFMISKHLMLLFNFYKNQEDEATEKFQNISCYCLTYDAGEVRIARADFKTSHVIV